MFSEMFKTLWENGVIQKGIFETIYMTLLSTLIAYVIGLPLGIILNITSDNGLTPNKPLNKIFKRAYFYNNTFYRKQESNTSRRKTQTRHRTDYGRSEACLLFARVAELILVMLRRGFVKCATSTK